MSVTALYGKCRELGYCDCGGFFGCTDDEMMVSAPVTASALASAKQGERETSDYRNHNLAGPRITKVGYVPYAYCPTCKKGLYSGKEHDCTPAEAKPLFCDECQENYEGKPSEHLQRVHGHAKASKVSRDDHLHALFDKPKEESMPELKSPTISPKPCGYCRKRGAPCVKHGGERSGVYTPKKKKIRDAASRDYRLPGAPLPEPDFVTRPDNDIDQEVEELLTHPINDQVIEIKRPSTTTHRIQMELPGMSLHDIGEVANFAAKHGGQITVVPTEGER